MQTDKWLQKHNQNLKSPLKEICHKSIHEWLGDLGSSHLRMSLEMGEQMGEWNLQDLLRPDIVLWNRAQEKVFFFHFTAKVLEGLSETRVSNNC